MATWVLVCDASRARVFAARRSAEDGFHLRLLREFENPAGRARVSDLVSDRPGRVRQSSTGATPSMAAQHDAAEVESDRFAHDLGRHLEQGFDAHDFERVVLVAPPRFLGVLRQKLSDPVARAVRLSLDKDFTMLEERDLEQRMEAVLAT